VMGLASKEFAGKADNKVIADLCEKNTWNLIFKINISMRYVFS